MHTDEEVKAFSRSTALWSFALLYLGLFFTYVFTNLFHNHLPYDDGKVLANSWKILNGEFPYRDFIYNHPPISPYLHLPALLLPEGWQFLGARVFFFFQMTIAGFAPCFWAIWNFPHMRSFRLLMLSVVFFAFSLHSFPPMPWPSTDGVFFASLALTALLFSFSSRGRRREIYFRGLAGVLLFAAGLCKQGYFSLPAAFFAFGFCEFIYLIWQKQSLRRSVWTMASVILSALAFVLFLKLNNAFADFLTQVAVRSDNGLWQVGLRPYVFGPWQIIILLGFVIPVSSIFVQLRHKYANHINRFLDACCFVMFFLLALMSLKVSPFVWTYPLFWLLLGIFIGRLIGYFLLNLSDRLPFIALNFATIILAWSTSISLGYQMQLLGIMPLALVLHDRLGQETANKYWRSFMAICACAILIIFVYQNQRPIHRGHAITKDLGKIFPRFGKLHGTEITAEAYTELRDLSILRATSMGRPFVVIPHFPLIYFLTKTINPLDANWIHEIEYSNQDERLWFDLKAKDPLVFIMRHIDDIHGKAHECAKIAESYFAWNKRYSEQYGSKNTALIPHLILKSKLIHQSKYFCIFDPDLVDLQIPAEPQKPISN